MAKGKFAIGAIIGALGGVVAGVLTAPKSGKETRQDLKDKADGLKAEAGAKKDQALDATDKVVDEVKARIEDAVDGVASEVKKRF